MYLSFHYAARYDQDILFVLPVQTEKKNTTQTYSWKQFFTVFQKEAGAGKHMFLWEIAIILTISQQALKKISHKVSSIKSRTYVQQTVFHVLLRNLLD